MKSFQTVWSIKMPARYIDFNERELTFGRLISMKDDVISKTGVEEILTKNKATTPPQDQEPLSLSMLAAALPQEQKQMLGECLFPLIQKQMLGQIAGKITGMMLEKDNSQILKMIESSEVLTWEVRAAVNQLIKHI